MADERITESGKFPQSYHLVWLQAHPWRSQEWLKERMRDGFHIHHVDGDHSNDDPSNLVLIDGVDHLALHAGSLRAGIRLWRKLVGFKGAKALAEGRRRAALKRAEKLEAFRREEQPAISSWTPVAPDPTGIVTPEIIDEARNLMSSGLSLQQTLSTLHPKHDVGWKRLRNTLRRELVG